MRAEEWEATFTIGIGVPACMPACHEPCRRRRARASRHGHGHRHRVVAQMYVQDVAGRPRWISRRVRDVRLTLSRGGRGTVEGRMGLFAISDLNDLRRIH